MLKKAKNQFLFSPLKKEKDLKAMKELMSAKDGEIPQLPQAGELIEGKIIEISKHSLVLDLGTSGTGIIYGAELKENKELFKGLKINDLVSALVLDPENEDGYVELSLKEADQEKTWQKLKEQKQSQEIINAKIISANRGGLVVDIKGLDGFLPVSQLSGQKYPQIADGDKNKILSHLNKFINQEIKVKIISLNQNSQQIIVSEKATE